MMEIDSQTRQYFERKEEVYERYMINYFSMGEDARVGTGFEKKRTKNRCCNNVNYAFIGLCNFFCGVCCCQRPPLISEQVECVRSLADDGSEKTRVEADSNHNYLPIIEEESKQEPLLKNQSN
jgi:diacylglycerol kinase (ATP)